MDYVHGSHEAIVTAKIIIFFVLAVGVDDFYY